MIPERNEDARFSRLSLDYNDPNGHLAFSRFGLAQQQEETQIDTLLRELPAVRPSIAEIISLTSYQTEYGIFDHDADRGMRPLALVALHPKEDAMEGGPLFTHIRKFHSHRIYKHFGLSLAEFMELPPYVVELLYEMAEAEAVRNEVDHNQISRQMEIDFEE